ncbi:unnamed protein product [Protopolystoma xenopodis]|uniref:Uncharacterized protein n=1 Tax=Protopolystoma xenopodis TaxID=117903 RepID=A0A448XHK7_9PLAT|nr:unnamed protein product [Protopolystoma xenopodis]
MELSRAGLQFNISQPFLYSERPHLLTGVEVDPSTLPSDLSAADFTYQASYLPSDLGLQPAFTDCPLAWLTNQLNQLLATTFPRSSRNTAAFASVEDHAYFGAPISPSGSTSKHTHAKISLEHVPAWRIDIEAAEWQAVGSVWQFQLPPRPIGALQPNDRLEMRIPLWMRYRLPIKCSELPSAQDSVYKESTSPKIPPSIMQSLRRPYLDCSDTGLLRDTGHLHNDPASHQLLPDPSKPNSFDFVLPVGCSEDLLLVVGLTTSLLFLGLAVLLFF